MDRRNPDFMDASSSDHPWSLGSGAPPAIPDRGRLCRNDEINLNSTALAGDVLVVWKLDRLGWSLSHLVAVLADLQKRGVAFLSLTEAIDTESAAGRLMGHRRIGGV